MRKPKAIQSRGTGDHLARLDQISVPNNWLVPVRHWLNQALSQGSHILDLPLAQGLLAAVASAHGPLGDGLFASIMALRATYSTQFVLNVYELSTAQNVSLSSKIEDDRTLEWFIHMMDKASQVIAEDNLRLIAALAVGTLAEPYDAGDLEFSCALSDVILHITSDEVKVLLSLWRLARDDGRHFAPIQPPFRTPVDGAAGRIAITGHAPSDRELVLAYLMRLSGFGLVHEQQPAPDDPEWPSLPPENYWGGTFKPTRLADRLLVLAERGGYTLGTVPRQDN